MLIPGQEDLKRRTLKAPAEHKLRDWFFSVEARAWTWVNASTSTRPENIFLVTGQTLATEYAISHVDTASSSCAISFKAAVKIPEAVDASFLLGNDVKSIAASVGFEDIKKPEGPGDAVPIFSLFIEVEPSYPLRILTKSKYKEILKAYAYVLYHRAF